jgi:hypothetical protein
MTATHNHDLRTERDRRNDTDRPGPLARHVSPLSSKRADDPAQPPSITAPISQKLALFEIAGLSLTGRPVALRPMTFARA